MSDETRFERWLVAAVGRAASPRGATIVIATATIVITVGAGFAMTAVDRENYPTIGTGLWWSIQTITTVGYGDHVPVTDGGRLVAALVMLFGIGFLTVVTAAITSAFISRTRAEKAAQKPKAPAAGQHSLEERLERIEAALAPTAEHARQLDERLERIEAALKRALS
jgi:voltage-gated potassium channel